MPIFVVWTIVVIYVVAFIATINVFLVFKNTRNGELRKKLMAHFFWLSFAWGMGAMSYLFDIAIPDMHWAFTAVFTLIRISPLTIQLFCLAKFLIKYYSYER